MIILSLICLCAFFWLCYRCTALVLKLMYVLCIDIPLAVVLFVVGILLCCTILLIPVGKAVLALAGRVAFPF